MHDRSCRDDQVIGADHLTLFGQTCPNSSVLPRDFEIKYQDSHLRKQCVYESRSGKPSRLWLDAMVPVE